ncbi:acyl-CoA carboxylase subunit epsilon [Streptomyces sp. NPDC057445]|uniref:acyl-CoA carboxylase subunit epsilon n=1 Tax=Streptomyces sp. NPDC057445 TaxID=3346136 RepID=UPI0036872DA4
MNADNAVALSLASIRITRGNPTAEEVAALAVLLTARLRPAPPPGPSTRKLHARRPGPAPYTPPTSWAS